MKSTELYRLLRQELDPIMKAAGFKRAKAFLSWSRPHGDQHVVVWCQASRSGWDDLSGSQFVVEFQLSREPIVGAYPSRRARIAELLDDRDREAARSLQNAVVSRLRRPSPSHPKLHISPEVTKWYLARFVPVPEPYAEGQDIWFRYACAEDVLNWAKFIAERLGACVRQVESWS
jgi:hypothetical protein